MNGKKMQEQTNVLSEWVVTYPFTECTEKTYITDKKDENGNFITRKYNSPNDMNHCKQYFDTVYNFACERYGKENVIAGFVHMDETTPQIHIDIVPETTSRKTGKKTVSSASLLSKKELHEFQRDLQAEMNRVFGDNDYIINGRTKGDYTVEEMKERQKNEKKAQEREDEIAQKQKELDKQEDKIAQEREELKQREQDVRKRERKAGLRESNLRTRESHSDERERALDDREEKLHAKDKRLTEGLTALAEREKNMDDLIIRKATELTHNATQGKIRVTEEHMRKMKQTLDEYGEIGHAVDDAAQKTQPKKDRADEITVENNAANIAERRFKRAVSAFGDVAKPRKINGKNSKNKDFGD
jgi:DNA repair exonuclease SbcCD ATPase subunit